MQQEQISPVDTPPGTSPDPVDVFKERLMHRLIPLLMQQAAAMRTKLVGMSWVLAMISLIVLGCLTYRSSHREQLASVLGVYNLEQV